MAKITDPFAAYNIPPRPVPDIPPAPRPQRFVPGATSPLDRVKREHPTVTVQSAEEQRRAESLPTAIAAGNAAPRFGDPVTPPPFPPTTAAPVNANTGPKAGGSKTK
jgi:hypothetical protein